MLRMLRLLPLWRVTGAMMGNEFLGEIKDEDWLAKPDAISLRHNCTHCDQPGKTVECHYHDEIVRLHHQCVDP